VLLQVILPPAAASALLIASAYRERVESATETGPLDADARDWVSRGETREESRKVSRDRSRVQPEGLQPEGVPVPRECPNRTSASSASEVSRASDDNAHKPSSPGTKAIRPRTRSVEGTRRERCGSMMPIQPGTGLPPQPVEQMAGAFPLLANLMS